MKTFIIIASTHFMKSHPRAGEPTNFKDLIISGVKIHTIRGNYGYWKKIVDKVNSGEAVLEVREWSSKPYKSKQNHIRTFTELGIQKLNFHKEKYERGMKAKFEFDSGQIFQYSNPNNTHKVVSGWTPLLHKNDGFDNMKDFIDWFPNKLDGCIIHFTSMRY